MNKLIEQFDSLIETPQKKLGFGDVLSSKQNKKMILSAEAITTEQVSSHFDSILIKDLEFHSIKNVKSSINNSVGILNPDKNIKIKSLESAGYDYAILNDLNVASEILSSDKLTIGYQVTNNLEDELADIIEDLPFSFVYIDLMSALDLDKLSGIFTIAEITSKISKNIFLKLNKAPSLSTLNILNTLGVNSIVISHNVASTINLDQLVLNIDKIKPENPKNSHHYADLSSVMTDLDTSEDDY